MGNTCLHAASQPGCLISWLWFPARLPGSPLVVGFSTTGSGAVSSSVIKSCIKLLEILALDYSCICASLFMQNGLPPSGVTTLFFFLSSAVQTCFCDARHTMIQRGIT